MSEHDKSIESLLHEERIFYPQKEISEKAYIKSIEEFKEIYKRSIEDPEGFWSEKAEELISWFKKWDKVLEYSFVDNIFVKWFIGGKLNACYNCVDRHLEGPRKNKA
ncbi:MAG: acetyl-coenzyme A synthetase, partial [Actinobacteria bacterium]|nr:acetyl-coenzyme A synthetase [Actinomycetota bacterium]